MKKAGIITFHWATNYGAILQAFCLQRYLEDRGYEVEIINYKPRKFDLSWLNFLIHPLNYKNIKKFLFNKTKERKLEEFRSDYLRRTRLYRDVNALTRADFQYEIIVCGSDQILNPSFTLHGQNGKPSSAYYLDFVGNETRKLGYAVSFGCTQYPINAVEYARKWIQNFDVIGVRENSGLNILKQIEYFKDSYVVPDPTILYGNKLFKDIGITIPVKKEDYTCVYMIRREIEVKGNVRYIDDNHDPLTMQEWLHTISHATLMITNSYHGMIMAILSHVPFLALLEIKTVGMNDRFTTLLHRIGLEDRLCYDYNEMQNFNPIDWATVDNSLEEFKKSSYL